MRGKRISRKQKRVKAINRKTAARVSMHLLMGDQHDADRAAADKIRSFPTVPRLKQNPFPRERDLGFAGHWVDSIFQLQTPEEFVEMNVDYKEDAWYLRYDKRPNRKPKIENSGIVETNVAISSGLSRVLAELVAGDKLDSVRAVMLAAGLAGMAKLVKRSRYLPAYMALHPDAEGTLSLHFGLWPIDREKRCLIGISATGKKGKKGLKLLGDCFMAVLRHHRAIGLPEDLIRQPMKNMRRRHPADWAAGLVMDKVVRAELAKMPEGEKLLAQADEYQKEAARNWLERYGAGAAGVAKLKVERDTALKAAQNRKKAAERLARIKAKKHGMEVHNIQEQASEHEKKSAQLSAAMADQSEQLENAKLILGAVDGEGVVEAARRMATLAEKPPVEKIVEPEVVKEVENATGELVELGKLLKERMEGHKSKDNWDKGVSLPERARGFLDWLENEPKRLMEIFRKLAKPVLDLLHGYDQAKKLRNFLFPGKTTSQFPK